MESTLDSDFYSHTRKRKIFCITGITSEKISYFVCIAVIFYDATRRISMTVSKQPRRTTALMITFLNVEYIAIQKKLSNPDKDVTVYGAKCESGIFQTQYGPRIVAILQTSSGGTRAAVETERAIQYFQPEIVLFVGIAAGLKGVNLGDVVIASKVYGYESGEAKENTQPRPQILSSSYLLIQLAHMEVRKSNWLKRLTLSSSDKPKACVAPIVAGEKVIASTSSDTYHFLLSGYSDAVAIDMEGLGFLEAIQRNKNVNGIVIRGIADLISERESSPHFSNCNEIAADHASAFAFELLANLRAPQEQTTPPALSGSSLQEIRKPLEIFFAYAEKDERLVQLFQMELLMLKRRKLITSWYSVSTATGKDYFSDIKRNMDSARIILLFISPDFLCAELMKKIGTYAMERQQSNRVTVIPVLLHDTPGWQDAAFGTLQAIPKNKPVTWFADPDEAIEKVVNEVRAVVEKLRRSG